MEGFEFQLIEHRLFSDKTIHEPLEYTQNNNAFLHQMDVNAKAHGLTITHASTSNNGDDIHKQYFAGGLPPLEFLRMDIITYACTSLAAFALFIRNVVGTAKDWRDLRIGRKIKVRLGSKEIEITDGMDLLSLLNQSEKLIESSDRLTASSTRGPTRRRHTRRKAQPVRNS